MKKANYFSSIFERFLLNLQQCAQIQRIIFYIAKKTDFFNAVIDSTEFIPNRLIIFRQFLDAFYWIYNSVPKAGFLCVIKNKVRLRQQRSLMVKV